MTDAAVRLAPEEWLLGFARALRAAGLSVTPDRERTFLLAVAEVGAGERAGVYWSGRSTLTSSPADIDRYDAVFTAWFAGAQQPVGARRGEPLRLARRALPDEGGDGSGDADLGDIMPAHASEWEVLRHRDLAELSAQERHRLARLFDRLAPRLPRRPARRHVRTRRGLVDGPATLREQLRRMGEPGRVVHRRKGTRTRRVVLLVDVSGSMKGYADSLLRLAHTFVRTTPARGQVEVFTMGTRLTRVTRAMRERDPERALLAAGETVADWSGGTRLGESLGAFLDRWGRRGMARGAVVVVFSDGWERAEPELLGEQMRRLASLAHSVVWATPHLGTADYAPVQQGIAAALPHVDHFVAGHSLAAFEELLEVVAHA